MKKIALFSAVMALSACGGGQNVEMTSNASYGGEFVQEGSETIKTDGKGVYKIGNPYEINGIWYYPKEDYFYAGEGVASWYGPDFHNGITANGELYDMHGLTAAHPTLPLPTIARVTNKANGRSLIVRINDRGPFVNDRVIDVSKRAAQLLGFLEQGTTDVKVEVLAEQSKALKQELIDKGLVSNFGLDPATVDSRPIPVTTGELEEVGTIKQEPVKSNEITLAPKTLPRGIYIQIGAYGEYKNAQKAERLLSGIGKVNIYQIYVNDKTLYRVRLGPINTLQDANGKLSRVKLKGYKDAHIVEEKKPLDTPIGQRFEESMQ